ncbi:MAG TPA: hypothetical protein VE974_26995 [Thermoanaerobaculia bacterium]|nr:hypothetical protein [Thermoanaerobaculia bacterium]
MTRPGVLLLEERLRKYPAIERSLAFSRETLERIQNALAEALPSPTRCSPFVSVSGSLARLEGSHLSDVDCMIVYPGPPPPDAAEFRSRVYEVLASVRVKAPDCSERALERPNPKGVFAGDANGDELCERIGSRDEPYDNIARRLLLLLEAQALWNPVYFDELRTRLIDEYAEDVSDDQTKHFVLLINDLIRYFRTICVNYHAVKEDEPEKWPIRNIKLRHSRVLMYTSLLFCLAEMSKYEYGGPGRRRTDTTAPARKTEMLRSYIEMPALERFVQLYERNEDDNLFRLLGYYNNFLEALGKETTREELYRLEYEKRYQSTTFAALKVNSDAFAAEIMRFLWARRGSWSDRFYEYLIL